MTAPIRSMPELMPDELIAVVRKHQDIVEAFRIMKDRLGLTNEFIDDAGGLTKGHADKILGPSELKNWGPTTFDLFCEIFAIEFHVKIDMDAVKRMEGIWESREKPRARTKPLKVSQQAMLRVSRATGAMGAAVTNAMRTPAQRSESARNAALARWKAVRRAKRIKSALPIEAPPAP